MNDKTIIDGIDVSECGHYGKCSTYCYVVEELCSDNPNCYYKQLKRKEQECKELKKIINEAKNSKLDLKSFLVGEAVQNEYEQQLDQLKQTLAEIKKIAEKQVKRAPDGETFARPEIKQILQKVSEVM